MSRRLLFVLLGCVFLAVGASTPLISGPSFGTLSLVRLGFGSLVLLALVAAGAVYAVLIPDLRLLRLAAAAAFVLTVIAAFQLYRRWLVLTPSQIGTGRVLLGWGWLPLLAGGIVFLLASLRRAGHSS